MVAALAVGSAGQGSSVVDKLGDGSFTAASLLSPALRAATVAQPLPRLALASSQPVAARTSHSAGAPLPHILSLSPLILTLSLSAFPLSRRRIKGGLPTACGRDVEEAAGTSRGAPAWPPVCGPSLAGTGAGTGEGPPAQTEGHRHGQRAGKGGCRRRGARPSTQGRRGRSRGEWWLGPACCRGIVSLADVMPRLQRPP
jgi:hypothetical protein